MFSRAGFCAAVGFGWRQSMGSVMEFDGAGFWVEASGFANTYKGGSLCLHGMTSPKPAVTMK